MKYHRKLNIRPKSPLPTPAKSAPWPGKKMPFKDGFQFSVFAFRLKE
jgi:hypothetical protein